MAWVKRRAPNGRIDSAGSKSCADRAFWQHRPSPVGRLPSARRPWRSLASVVRGSRRGAAAAFCCAGARCGSLAPSRAGRPWHRPWLTDARATLGRRRTSALAVRATHARELSPLSGLSGAFEVFARLPKFSGLGTGSGTSELAARSREVTCLWISGSGF